tara:strand:- start:73 stop:228 length:156 start_codon:yes stop_codon:yes gene_type:complete
MPDKSYKSNREKKKDSKYRNNDNIYSNKHIRNKEFFILHNEGKKNKDIKKN